jgi:aquaporin Z
MQSVADRLNGLTDSPKHALDLPGRGRTMEHRRIFTAEAIGTAGLMLGGVGAAVFAGGDIGFLGVSLAFGLSLLALAALLGHVSGCHINPAVTVGLLLAGKVPGKLVPTYLIAQSVGAVIGGGIVFAIASGRSGFDASLGFAANGFGDLSPGGYGLLAVLAAEVVFTALFVLAVLATTRSGFPSGLGPVVAGLALALVHLVTIPISNTSVNPARSLGAAIFQGGDALIQLWVFLLAPLVGGALAAGIWRALHADIPAAITEAPPLPGTVPAAG